MKILYKYCIAKEKRIRIAYFTYLGNFKLSVSRITNSFFSKERKIEIHDLHFEIICSCTYLI